jgi:tetratricopeptide (TPR) repeat protein
MASMPEADRRIAAAILRYLKRISERDNVEDDSKESLDVASMCIQATFGVQPEEYQEVPPLEDLFGATGGGPSAGTPPAGMQDNLDKAEKLKNEGNVKLKESNYEAAISLYTSAIELAPSNAPYYSNRAAAYIKLEDFPKALSDCQEAVALNPNYARAHGRMGFIYTKLSQPHLAKEAFQN